MLSISIATAFPVFQEGLLRALQKQRELNVHTPAPDANSVLRCCCQHRCDVLVLDVLLPGPGTESLIRRLRQQGCVTEIVLFGDWTPELVAVATRVGARGIVSARDDAQVFAQAIRAAAMATRFVSKRVENILGKIEAEQNAPERVLERVLTPTERQVLRALADNRTSKEIAGELYISFRTVQKHRSNIVRKLHLDGSNALLTLAVRHFNGDNKHTEFR